jgi:lipoprotein NlpI
MIPIAITALLCGVADDSAAEAARLIRDATAALEKHRPKDAVELASRALTLQPQNARAWLVRGLAHGALREHEKAVADFNHALELAPTLIIALDHRGSERFKLGQFREALADFDAYLKVRPEETAGHWRRGIACYYAGRYDDGAKQFAAYEKIDTNDVENAVWRCMCMTRAVGVEKARAAMLKVGKDPRVPMMEVYALFLGKAKPEDVLAAAKAGRPSPEKLNEPLFYAHLYLGLYYDSLGERKQAREHLTEAVEKHEIGHYMWDVGRVHLDLLRKKAQ